MWEDLDRQTEDILANRRMKKLQQQGEDTQLLSLITPFLTQLLSNRGSGGNRGGVGNPFLAEQEVVPTGLPPKDSRWNKNPWSPKTDPANPIRERPPGMGGVAEGPRGPTVHQPVPGIEWTPDNMQWKDPRTGQWRPWVEYGHEIKQLQNWAAVTGTKNRVMDALKQARAKRTGAP